MMASEASQPVILVTGGTGFVGQHLLSALIEKGYHHIHATHFSSTKATPPHLDAVQYHAVDLSNTESVYQLIAELQPDQIYHLASLAAVGSSFQKAHSLLQNNIMLQLSFLEAVQRFSPQSRLLTIGSAEEYGFVADHHPIQENCQLNPTNPYAVSKVTQDLLAQAFTLSYALPIIRVRPFNHIGEGQSLDFVVPAFASQVAKIEAGQQTELQVGDLTAIRDFTDVKDMVQAYITLMEHGSVGEVYNVGSGTGIVISELLDRMIGLATRPIQVTQDQSRMRPSTAPYLVADAHKVNQLGWKTTIPLDSTLQRILNEWRQKL